jgi:rare lipoprotein A
MAAYKDLAIRWTVLGVALAGCGLAQDQPAAPAVEEGIASWYGTSFDGLRSASGEIYDSEQLTAAHRTLPFGTKVRVRRMGSRESIVVRINDRGPFVESRIIDLSLAAARQLGVMDPGLFRVAVEVVENAVAPLPPLFAVQVGSFRDPENARRTRDRMQGKFGEVTIQRSGELWRVLVGNASSQAEAGTLASAVRKSDDAYRSAYVVRLGQ